MEKSLKLSEKLFCLAVNPNRGGILLSASSVLGMTITGSVIVELMNNGFISIENGVVHLEKTTVQDDEIHEFFLNCFRLRKRDRKLRFWVRYFNNRRRKIQKLFIRCLVRKNVLRTEEKRILFIPCEKVYLMDRELIETTRKEIERAALRISESKDDSLILAVMVLKTNLLSRIFSERAKRKEAARNLKKVPETQITKAVQQAIQMMHAAVYASVS